LLAEFASRNPNDNTNGSMAPLSKSFACMHGYRSSELISMCATMVYVMCLPIVTEFFNLQLNIYLSTTPTKVKNFST